MKVALVFGQFGEAADLNLPVLNNRLKAAGVDVGLGPYQHDDTKGVVDFLRNYDGHIGLVGASLGAASVVVFAGYLRPQKVDYLAGFQPSVWDPQTTVDIRTGLHTVYVTANVIEAHCFRNPIFAATGGLGYATWALADGNDVTKLVVTPRFDTHPGDFGEAAEIVFKEIMELAK